MTVLIPLAFGVQRSRSAGFQTCCIADFQIGWPSECGKSRDPRRYSELKLVGMARCAVCAACSGATRVFMPVYPIIHQSINPEPGLELSSHSRLMGGQFPSKNDHAAFKNPIFYAGKFPGISRKKELSFLTGKNPSFFAFFAKIFGSFHISRQ
jgi:hypothetical protein